MKISILAVGTRGDIQPCVALAVELQKKGAETFVATHKEYEKLVTDNNIKYFNLPGNPANQWKADNGDNGKEKKLPINFKKQLEKYGRGWLKAGLEFCNDSDIIIYTPLFFVGNHLAEKLNVPFVPILFEPNLTTGEFPSPYFNSAVNFGKSFNKFTHKFAYRSFWRKSKDAVNLLRKEVLNLSQAPESGYLKALMDNKNPFLCVYSKYLSPKPNDWNGNINVTGYWFLDSTENYKPDKKLNEYLTNGAPPIYFDFGSFAHDRLKQKVKIIMNDLSNTKERYLIDAGKLDISKFKLPEDYFIIDSTVPHSYLLPRIKAIISHGGVGATHAATKAGTPVITIPMFPAQYFWGYKLYKKHLGSMPIPISKLKNGKVKSAIEYLERNQIVLTKLSEVKNLIENENGAETASNFILNYFSKN